MAGGALEALGSDPQSEHERLVAYVHAVNGDPEPRAGVWREHSYARGRGGGAAAAGEPHCRLLLLPRAAEPAADLLDVLGTEPARADLAPAPDPPAPLSDPEDGDEDSGAEDAWEARVEASVAAAGGGAGARRACARVLAALRALRLARLAGGGARESAGAAVARVRRALAGQWRGGAAARLHAALAGGGGQCRGARLYAEVAGELARAVPRLAVRLSPAPAASSAQGARAGPAVMPMASRPLLVWVGSGCDRHDARWERRLRALVPTHLIRLPNQGRGSGGAGGAGAAWAAWAGGAAAAALRGLEAEGALVVGGAGAGAALAAALARRDPRVRGVCLLGPPPPPPAPAVPRRLPALVACAPGAAARLGTAPAQSHTRLLLLAGVDHLLRLSRARRRALHVTQDALDAAVVEECARWLTELAEGALGDGEDDGDGQDAPEESPEPRAPLSAVTPHRAIEIVEGRVVSRACGAVPVPLAPPRAPPAPPRAPPAPRPAPPTRYTKVIVAKRAARGTGGVRVLRASHDR